MLDGAIVICRGASVAPDPRISTWSRFHFGATVGTTSTVTVVVSGIVRMSVEVSVTVVVSVIVTTSVVVGETVAVAVTVLKFC